MRMPSARRCRNISFPSRLLIMLPGTVVLKENHIQLITDELGDIPSSDPTRFGLYFFDTRYLSTFELRINGGRPLYLSHSSDRNYIATFQFVNPPMALN